MLLVHGLPAHAQLVRDVLPGPADAARVPHLERLELLDELPERRDGPQADLGIRVPRCPGEFRGLTHACQSTLTVRGCQPRVPPPPAAAATVGGAAPGRSRPRSRSTTYLASRGTPGITFDAAEYWKNRPTKYRPGSDPPPPPPRRSPPPPPT